MSATPPASSPHDAYDQYWARHNRRMSVLRSVGHVLGYVVGLSLAVALAALFVASVIDVAQPKVWGTFTQRDCEPQPRGTCRPIGSWVSDDGSMTKRDVYLDGSADAGGTTPASYRPDGIINDESNNIVHAPLLSDAGPWLTGAILLGWVGYMLYKANQWGDINLATRRRSPLAPADPTLPVTSLREARRRAAGRDSKSVARRGRRHRT